MIVGGGGASPGQLEATQAAFEAQWAGKAMDAFRGEAWLKRDEKKEEARVEGSTGQHLEESAAEYYERSMDALAQFACFAASSLAHVDLDFLESTIWHAHSWGPIIDPTSYRNGQMNLRDQEKLLRTTKNLLNVVAEITQEGQKQEG